MAVVVEMLVQIVLLKVVQVAVVLVLTMPLEQEQPVHKIQLTDMVWVTMVETVTQIRILATVMVAVAEVPVPPEHQQLMAAMLVLVEPGNQVQYQDQL